MKLLNIIVGLVLIAAVWLGMDYCCYLANKHVKDPSYRSPVTWVLVGIMSLGLVFIISVLDKFAR
jgi:hypothetical protein